ncbi:hypothetical protein ID866_10319 [Astraeus odoratus]|nr:hypothetical protein ID866_10319 [Astraeus odoratus]
MNNIAASSLNAPTAPQKLSENAHAIVINPLRDSAPQGLLTPQAACNRCIRAREFIPAGGMHLLSVKAVLDFEDNGHSQNEVLKHVIDGEPQGIGYAVLSHCWCAEEEVKLWELQQLSPQTAFTLRTRSGYRTIVESCRRAKADGLQWVWTASSCIMEENCSELSEALNSMYWWYAKSERCYAYLHDVDEHALSGELNMDRFDNGWPAWFCCSWTLQELLAPNAVLFYNRHWQCIGDKIKLASTLAKITGIPQNVIAKGLPPSDDPCRPSVAQIMAWAAHRTARKVEDKAYTLMGLFGVHISTKYVESEKAFHRLQMAILANYSDHTIFAWSANTNPSNVLAHDPTCFSDSTKLVNLTPYDAFIGECPKDEEEILDNQDIDVTEKGIEIWLPVAQYSGYPHLIWAKLACYGGSNNKDLVTILLEAVPSKGADVYIRATKNISPVSEQLTFRFERLYLVADDERECMTVPTMSANASTTDVLPWPSDYQGFQLFQDPSSSNAKVLPDESDSCLVPFDRTYQTVSKEIFFSNPSEDIPTDHTQAKSCGWVTQGKICGEVVTIDDYSAHLAIAHGIRKIPSSMSVYCCWCCPPRMLKRESILRHSLEVHLGVPRLKRKRS